MIRLTTVLLSALLLVAAGCGTPDDDEGTQPAPAVTSFEQGRFDDLPLPTESEPVGKRSEQDGVVTRSYKVEGMTPQHVLAFYEETLADRGWTSLGVEEMRNGYRGDWSIEDWELRVSANQAPGLGESPNSDAKLLTQLSLVLTPS